MSAPAPATPAAPSSNPNPAAAPAPTASPPTPPPAAPPAKAAPPAAAPPVPPAPLTGDIQDVGTVRRDSVRARSWNARGGAKVLGDVEVETSQLAGLVSIKGKIRAQRFRIDGTLDSNGPVEVTGPLEVSGTALLTGPVQAGSLELKGAGKIAGPLRVAGTASWKGALEVLGDLTAGGVDFEGTVRATGDLVAPTITGRLKGASSVENIRTTTLTLTRPGLFPPMQTGVLRVVRIDARDARLEGVDAELVRAEQVTVGPGCHIAAIEGRLVSVHPSSHVGPESRSPKPYGLFR
jgi:cytoskeletal protein CcmA (bactofilin family)